MWQRMSRLVEREPEGDSSRGEVDLASKVAYLCQLQTEAVETRLSWVFLGEHDVYKLKKPLRDPFVDLRALEQRRTNCEREVRLNRRLAPGVYLGTVAMTLESSGKLALGGHGQVVEWLVHMRRLPREQMLDYALAHGGCRRDRIQRAARTLARFYVGARSERLSPAAYFKRLAGETTRRVRVLQTQPVDLGNARLRQLLTRQQCFLQYRRALLESRAAEGRVVEGHGDLRPQHVCIGPQPLFIDCLEFSRSLRVLDPLDDLAYLALECEYAGASWVGDEFLRIYTDLADDHQAGLLVAFYASRRAVLRAYQALRHIRAESPPRRLHWLARTQRYLALAEINAERASTDCAVAGEKG